jgi:hypothetical protein
LIHVEYKKLEYELLCMSLGASPCSR